MEDVFGAFGLVAILFGIFITFMWAIIPFMIIGVSNRLDKLNKNVAKIGKLLKEKDNDPHS